MTLRTHALPGILAVFLLTACGPTTFTKTRIDWQPVADSPSLVKNENVTVEAIRDVETSPDLYVDLQRCAVKDTLEFDKKGLPVMEKVSVVSPGQVWRRIAITNRDEHVLRVNGLVIRLFTPDGHEWLPLERDAIVSALRKNRPCPSSQNAAGALANFRFLQKGVDMIVPGSTSLAWLVFQPPATETQPGVWKLGIYEMPVKVGDTGKIAKTGRFEFRYKAVKYVDTYRQENFLAIPKLIETVEAP
jgi:hypothetical protein